MLLDDVGNFIRDFGRWPKPNDTHIKEDLLAKRLARGKEEFDEAHLTELQGLPATAAWARVRSFGRFPRRIAMPQTKAEREEGKLWHLLYLQKRQQLQRQQQQQQQQQHQQQPQYQFTGCLFAGCPFPNCLLTPRRSSTFKFENLQGSFPEFKEPSLLGCFAGIIFAFFRFQCRESRRQVAAILLLPFR